MAISTSSYALLAQAVYDNLNSGGQVAGTDFKVKEIYLDQSGYYGAIFENIYTHELVVASRGTEFTNDAVRDVIQSDGQMLIFGINQQLDGARHLVEEAIELSKTAGSNGGPVPVTVTGHSMGGSLAQVMSYEYNLYGETFNAFGVAGICGVPTDGRVPEGHNEVISHVRATDIVGLAHKQYGEVNEYATVDDTCLILAGADSGPEMMLDVIFEVSNLTPGKTHSIDFFVGDDSVISQENEQRYETYQNEFDAYRSRIQLAVDTTGTALGMSLVLDGYLLRSYLENKVISFLVGQSVEDAANTSSDVSYLRGTRNADTLTGGNGTDLLFGDGGDDVLRGGMRDDRLYGGDQDDYLDGGEGSDQLEGGDGYDRYNFSLNDFASYPGSTDVVADSDASGQIEIDNNQFSVGRRLSATTWSSLDEKFIVTADLSLPSQTLAIRNRSNGNVILVRDWGNGELGIDLGGEILAPQALSLTGGDDLFGHAGNNAGSDNLTALGGNDGIAAGVGDDTVDGGLGRDLVFGGTGDDHLKGGDDEDLIIDGSEQMDMTDWSDVVGDDGKSQRQREQGNMEQLGAAVVAKGKGWYIYETTTDSGTSYTTVTAQPWTLLDPNASPSGNDVIDGGAGADHIWSGEGNDTVLGGDGEGADYIDAGADDDVVFGGAGDDVIRADLAEGLVAGVHFSALVSDAANKNGNDIVHAGDGNDTVKGGGGNDNLLGGLGDDLIHGRGSSSKVDDDDPDRDYIDGGVGNDAMSGDDGDDSLRGGDGDDVIRGDNARANTRHGNDTLDGGAGNDQLGGDGGDDILRGGDGADTLAGDGLDVDPTLHGRDYLDGGVGNDQLFGFGGDDVLLGGDGDDVLSGDSDESQLSADYHGNDGLYGGKGNDSLFGNGGDDVLSGGEGNDIVRGGKGADYLSGDADDDQLIGDEGDDRLSGGEGIDTLWGAAGNDELSGGAGADFLMGDTPDLPSDQHGADVLHGGDGNDTVLGEGGNDSVYGGGGDDKVQGGTGNDLVYGDDGNDILLGMDGDDMLDGGVGADTLYGGAGNDTLAGGADHDILVGGLGINTFVVAPGGGYDAIVAPGTSLPIDAVVGGVLKLEGGLTPGSISLERNGEHLTVRYEGGSVAIQNYFLQYDPSSSVDHGGDSYFNFSPVTSIHFADGTAWALADVKNALIQSTGGGDVITGFENGETIHGGDGDDTLSGKGGSDVLYGDAGDDQLDGGVGLDRLVGGAGNDQLTGGLGTDVYVFARGDGQDTIDNHDGQPGGDAVEFASGIAPTDIATTRSGDDLYLRIQGTDDQIKVLNFFQNEGQSDYALGEVRFADGTVWSSATLLAQVLLGGTGDDAITGYATDDVLQGSAGNDTLNGGAGDDTVQGGDGGDVLLGADGNDVLTGGAGVDTLDGGAGNDDLTGGQGNDAIGGGAGDDTYRYAVGDGSDVVSDVGGLSTLVLSGTLRDDVYFRREGADLTIHLNGRADDQLAFADWFDPLTGVAVRDLIVDFGDGVLVTMDAAALATAVTTGGEADDALYGDDTVNTMAGLGGDDVIHAAGGDDVATGGDGKDQLFGEAGDDDLGGGAGDDRLDGGDGNDQLTGGAGNDMLYGEVGDDVLSGGTGQDQLEGGSGADQLQGDADADVLLGAGGNDVLSGGIGNDQLDGGSDADQLSGGAGDDTYVVDNLADVVVEAADEGGDTIQSSVSYTLSAHVERLELSGSASVDGFGNALDNALIGNGGGNHLEGQDGVDVLLGNVGDDTLVGGAGNDQLDGGDGVDQMTGGSGDDTYVVDTESDVIVEQTGEGFDVVNAHSNYTLSAHIENLVLVEGSGAWRGSGNGSDNTLLGNSSSNRLDGGAGADTLTGGLGGDTYVVDNVGDQVVEAAAEGEDTVESSIDYVLGATLENLTLLGTANLNGTGNDQDNVLIGNDGGNRLEGGLGPDALHGGLGDDYFIEESSADWVYENAEEGLDTVERRYETDLVLKDHVENLILASGVTTGNGNALDNTLSGNADANTLGGWEGDDLLHGLAGDDALFGGNGGDRLTGEAGNDYLDGGLGIDQLEGGAGNDTYITDDAVDAVSEGADAGTDAVQTTASYALSAHIENLFLMNGAGAIDGSGNGMDNYLSGNGANNVLNGMGGSDTMVAGAGNDQLIGGVGDDKYVFDAASGSDVVDSSGGGNDGVFFTNGVDRDRLSFGRDGDDLLIFVDAATTESVRVTNHFLGGDAAIDYVQPDGGFMLTTAQINQIVAGGSTGGQYDQVIDGTAAGEQLVGSAGKDLIKGLAGNDQLFGLAGDDALQGGDGDDYLAGGGGSGSGSGADRLEGGAGSDTLNGEDGSNTLLGGAGDDSYVYAGGQDTIDNTDGGFDGVFFDDGITAAQLGFSRDGNDLLITVNGDADATVRVTKHFLGGDWAVDYVQPASGSMLDTAAINALVGGDSGGGDPGTPPEPGNDGDYSNTVDGTAAGEQLLGSNGRDLIHGLGGNDTLFGFGGDDKFDGGDGDDYVSGGNGSFSGSGNDILIGGAGVDTLVGEDGEDLLLGGVGNDKYIWQAGSGSDVIDNTGGGTDWLFFNGVDRTRLSFHQSGDDLIILVDGDAAQQVRVQNHFLGGDQAISYVQPSDGYAIPAGDFSGLLTPMPAASMALPAATTMSLVANPSAPSLAATSAASAVTPDTLQTLSAGAVGTGPSDPPLADESGQQTPLQNPIMGEEPAFGDAAAHAISVQHITGPLTPLPATFVPPPVATASLVAEAWASSVVAKSATPAASQDAHPPVRAMGPGSWHADRWRRSAPYRGNDIASCDTQSGTGRSFGHGVGVSQQAQQLIEAMSRFQPVAGEASSLQPDMGLQNATLAANHDTIRQFKEPHAASML